MTSIARDPEKLRELEDEVRRAWVRYAEELHGLTGQEYERTETTSWEELQAELARLDRSRQSLSITIF